MNHIFYLHSKTTHHWREYHNETVEEVAVVHERSNLDNLQYTCPGIATIMQCGQKIEGQWYYVECQRPCNDIGGSQSIIIDGNAEDGKHCGVSM